MNTVVKLILSANIRISDEKIKLTPKEQYEILEYRHITGRVTDTVLDDIKIK